MKRRRMIRSELREIEMMENSINRVLWDEILINFVQTNWLLHIKYFLY